MKGTEERKQSYEKRKSELLVRCKNCKEANPERCNNCITGKRLRWLETEYSDVSGWSHSKWRN